MEGIPGSIYEGGLFEINYQFPQDYPFRPPRVEFSTPIYHYAISQTGQICMDSLRDCWSPALTLVSVLTEISQLVFYPQISDPDVCFFFFLFLFLSCFLLFVCLFLFYC